MGSMETAATTAVEVGMVDAAGTAASGFHGEGGFRGGGFRGGRVPWRRVPRRWRIPWWWRLPGGGGFHGGGGGFHGGGGGFHGGGGGFHGGGGGFHGGGGRRLDSTAVAAVAVPWWRRRWRVPRRRRRIPWRRWWIPRWRPQVVAKIVILFDRDGWQPMLPAVFVLLPRITLDELIGSERGACLPEPW